MDVGSFRQVNGVTDRQTAFQLNMYRFYEIRMALLKKRNSKERDNII